MRKHFFLTPQMFNSFCANFLVDIHFFLPFLSSIFYLTIKILFFIFNLLHSYKYWPSFSFIRLKFYSFSLTFSNFVLLRPICLIWGSFHCTKSLTLRVALYSGVSISYDRFFETFCRLFLYYLNKYFSNFLSGQCQENFLTKFIYRVCVCAYRLTSKDIE